MNDTYSQLSKLIANCKKLNCPLYQRFFNTDNAQSSYRISHFEWSSKFSPSKISIKNKSYGAKLAIIMESPPPMFNEYFYGEEGGLYNKEGGIDKEEGLYACILKALIKSIGKEILNSPKGNSIATDKNSGLKWIAEQGVVIVDAAKCRFKISDAFRTDKLSTSVKNNAFKQCSEILELQLKYINPYKIVVGIASVFNSEIVDTVINQLGFNDRFINKKFLSPFHGRSIAFIEEISNVITAVYDSINLHSQI